MSFEKKYNPKEVESKLREFWGQESIYSFDENSSKPIYSIDTPPPTMSGKMHIGHAFSYSQQDFIARYKRMTGYEVYYPFGTDDNGLATEKLVQKERKIDLRKVPRNEAIQVCIDYIKENRANFIQDWKNIGISCDFDKVYSTIDDYSRKISQKSFLDLNKKGLVYRKKGPVMWDRVFETAIAQAELEDNTRKAYLNYTKAKLSNSENTYLIYATTRPELLFAAVGISVQDVGDYVKLKVNDEYWITGASTYEEKFSEFDFEVVERLKGQELIGERAVIPKINRELEISHDVSVQADFGTGIAYFCTYGGVEDIEWTIRHKKTPVEVIDKRGRLNSIGEEYEGMLAEEARKKIIEELENKGDIIKKEQKEQVVNVGERSGAEVEFVISNQWYVQYLDKKEHFWEQAEKFNWHPEFMKSRIENWIKGLNWDWGISRQRHFGIPIPVWYDKKGNIYFADESQLPVDPTQDRPLGVQEDLELTPETDVFDTWFTSSSSPILAINLVEDDKLRNNMYPMSLRPQAHDIINFWLFYTMAKSNLIYEENPFKDVAISGWVLAPDGTKMSKSKGNTVVPQDVVEKYSNDAIRYAAAASKLGSDQPYMEKEVQTGYKITNKLYNANKFASMLLDDFNKSKIDYSKLNSIDKWILSKGQEIARISKDNFDKYDYQKAKSLYSDYFMSDIADNYIEIVKQRLWQKKENYKYAQSTLYEILYLSLRGLAPIMPFITEEVYQSLYKNYEDEKSIHLTSYPEFNEELFSKKDIELGDKFVEIVSLVRRYKAENNYSMKEEIKELSIQCNEELREFIESSVDDLKAVTNSIDIKFSPGEFKVKIN